MGQTIPGVLNGGTLLYSPAALPAAEAVLLCSATGAMASQLVTAAGLALLGDADAAAQRSTLGLGNSAIRNTTGNALTVCSGFNAGAAGTLAIWDETGFNNVVSSGLTPDDLATQSPLTLTSGDVGEVPLTIQAAAGQTAPLLVVTNGGVNRLEVSSVSVIRTADGHSHSFFSSGGTIREQIIGSSGVQADLYAKNGKSFRFGLATKIHSAGLGLFSENKRSGIDLEVGAGILAREVSADPADPSEGEWCVWMSDGTGSGDDGDVMIKITAGGITKTATLIDFSGI